MSRSCRPHNIGLCGNPWEFELKKVPPKAPRIWNYNVIVSKSPSCGSSEYGYTAERNRRSKHTHIPSCSNFSQSMPAAVMISFDAFDQFHPIMAPQCNSNNYPWSHYCCTMIFIQTMRCWKAKLIEELEMAGRWKQDIHTDFKPYTALKNGLILLVIFATITILGRQRNWKMPLFYCVGIVLFTRKIRPKLLARQPLLPPPPPMPHPTCQITP